MFTALLLLSRLLRKLLLLTMLLFLFQKEWLQLLSEVLLLSIEGKVLPVDARVEKVNSRGNTKARTQM